jgi:effector-binding domain-containing protein
MYKVVLDEKSSYIVPSDTGMGFEDAVTEIIEYAREASYELQEVIWELILSDGEDAFSRAFVTTA